MEKEDLHVEALSVRETTKSESMKDSKEYSTTFETILEKLADDSNAGVREAVAQNLKTPERVLENLANDTDNNVRISVAFNQNTSELVLKKLASDS